MAERSSSLTKKFAKAAGWILGMEVLGLIALVAWHVNLGGVSLVTTIAPAVNAALDNLGFTDAMFWLSGMLGGGATQAAAKLGGSLVSVASSGVGAAVTAGTAAIGAAAGASSVFVPGFVG